MVGPSGCGKTTLLRMIAGLERPDYGQIKIAGRDVTLYPPERRDVSIVFQHFALFPNMNVIENVAYGLKMRRVPRRERMDQVQELLQLVGLQGLGHRRPNQLSAGQQQRVALARALAPQPKTLLLDEPLSALDASIRVRLRDELREMQRRLGITTIMVTHDQDEALAVADRVAVMNDGSLEQVGTPWSLYDAPETAFVAKFIGRGNYLAAVVKDHEISFGPLGTLPRGHETEALRPGPIVALIRPESVVLSAELNAREDRDPKTAPLSFDAVVKDVIFEGERSLVGLRTVGADIALEASVGGSEAPKWSALIGERVSVSIPVERIRWIKHA